MTDSKNSGSVLSNYAERVRAFTPNARFYLLSVLLAGALMGVFRLLFNFFVLSLGFNEALIGNLITVTNFSALIVALPMGYLVDIVGHKRSLVARTILLAFSIAVMAIWPTVAVFYVMNALFGLAMSLGQVTMGPFMMANSGEEERTYLFSIGQGLQMSSVFVGNWLGGYLPGWIGLYRNVEATSAPAYAGALLVIAVVGLLAVIPLLFLKRQYKAGEEERQGFAPFEYVKNNPRQMLRVFLPLLFVSVGAGLFVPFMNVFFRVVHNQPDPVIGSLMAWGSLAMGVGLLIAPPLSDRLGKIRLVLLTQGLSIPFMVLLGFAPWFAISAFAYYVRMGLMNMSNPIYQNFVLEKVDANSRATVASLYSMVWSFGRAFSPAISGVWQVQYGFGLPFAVAIVLYACAITLYWVFFIRNPQKQPLPAVVGD
ncbi:MAG: MFS transporter [Chloroflexi bacterium]|nr:MAG: MFS transporter [Chloroflexota bacterium]MBL1192919.1 MFS transporter [Chloroflexota bacterium]NOH10212.1 MFS transporter [Chloroflexota bacterium]